MQKQGLSFTAAAVVALIAGTPFHANAQRVFFGAGIGVGNVPRALSPLCGAPRRLSGPSLSTSIGLEAKRVRISTGVDYTRTPVHSTADCAPRNQQFTDSTFARAGASATTASVDFGYQPLKYLGFSVGGGWVVAHNSWYTSAGLSSQYRKVRLEMAARRHRIGFTEAGGQGGIPAASQTETSWGAQWRLLMVTR